MAGLTSYGPLLGGYRSLNSDRPWDRAGRRSGLSEDAPLLPFGGRTPPRRKELPRDLLGDPGTTASQEQSTPGVKAAAGQRDPALPLRDSELAFMLDFNAPFLRAVTRVDSPSDVIFRERAVYWDLSPARAAFGKVLYRQDSFFVNRIQDTGLGRNLNSFW